MEITTPAHELGVGSQHSAFPSVVRLDEKTLMMAWRQGSNHATNRDGTIRRAMSRNNGVSWGEETHLREAAGGIDLRDPSISYARGALHMTMFTGSSTAPARAAYDLREWGDVKRIDPMYGYAAITSPTVELPNGMLGTAFYGRQMGESIDTSFMAWTVDHGLTWTTNRIANGISSGHAYNEPFLVRDGSDIHVFFRSGTTAIGMRSSPDSGATWGPVREILTNATGRPSTFCTSGGVLVMVYRSLPSKAAQVAYSSDHGATWLQGATLMVPPAGSPNGMTYAAMFEPDPGQVGVVFGMENTLTSSVLYGATIGIEP